MNDAVEWYLYLIPYSSPLEPNESQKALEKANPRKSSRKGQSGQP